MSNGIPCVVLTSEEAKTAVRIERTPENTCSSTYPGVCDDVTPVSELPSGQRTSDNSSQVASRTDDDNIEADKLLGPMDEADVGAIDSLDESILDDEQMDKISRAQKEQLADNNPESHQVCDASSPSSLRQSEIVESGTNSECEQLSCASPSISTTGVCVQTEKSLETNQCSDLPEPMEIAESHNCKSDVSVKSETDVNSNSDGEIQTVVSSECLHNSDKASLTQLECNKTDSTDSATLSRLSFPQTDLDNQSAGRKRSLSLSSVSTEEEQKKPKLECAELPKEENVIDLEEENKCVPASGPSQADDNVQTDMKPCIAVEKPIVNGEVDSVGQCISRKVSVGAALIP